MFRAPTWSIAIFACRETLATLSRCILAARNATGTHQAIIHVLVNGNDSLARETALAATGWQTAHCEVRVWMIEQGDKAHAWNEYLHRIWTPDTLAFFLDAYAEAQPHALERLAAVFDGPTVALAATGVPSEGRSAAWQREKMLREGGLQGNLHVLGIPAMTRLRTLGFRMPLGLYRTDSLVNAVLNFNLDPAQNKWDASRIAVVGNASWDVQNIARLTLANIVGQIKRRVRQARGILENRAVREHLAVQRQSPESLPDTVHELVSKWLQSHAAEARALFIRSPLTYYSSRHFNAPRDWSASKRAPVCMTDQSLSSARKPLAGTL